MNIGEAIKMNTVLYYLLDMPGKPIAEQAAKEAAAYLAERANKSLSAGVSGEQVLKAWPKKRRRAK